MFVGLSDEIKKTFDNYFDYIDELESMISLKIASALGKD